jgi:transposase
MPDPRAVEIRLTDTERAELERLANRRRTQNGLALRARIVLSAAAGMNNSAIAGKFDIDRQTAARWRHRFVEGGVDALYDEPKPGAPRKVTDEHVEAVICKTLESKPRGATHWSTRSMAQATGLSQSTISRVWRAFGLKPQRTETFAISTDPLFVEKVRDIVGLYMNPPDNAVVLCVDEKSQIQALDRTQPLLPMLPGTPARHTPTYSRHGTTSLFAALNAKTGEVIGECRRRHTARQFIEFLRTIDRVVPDDLEVHVVMDNLATHKTDSVRGWFSRHPRFQPHFTPTYSSWLNLVERWFGLLEQRQLKRAAHRSVLALERSIREFLEVTNEEPRPFIWTKSADQILSSLSRYCGRISDSGH